MITISFYLFLMDDYLIIVGKKLLLIQYNTNDISKVKIKKKTIFIYRYHVNQS